MREYTEVDMADQQLTGFAHCFLGYDIKELCEAMGLRESEWEEIKKRAHNENFPKTLSDEIDEYFKEQRQ